jgi:putative ABC transport system permease protein
MSTGVGMSRGDGHGPETSLSSRAGMSTTRLLRSSLRALRRQRLRTAFMMLGSLIGVAALTFVLTVGAAAQQKILATVRQLFGPSSIVVTAGGGFFMGGPHGQAARMPLDDAAALARAVPDIEDWDPMQVVPASPVRRGDATQTVRLLGESERSERVWSRSVSQGEYFDQAAVNGAARVALIGETVVRALFGEEDPIGGEILIGSVPFRVTGILERQGTDIHGMDRDNEIVIPISTAMRRVMNVDVIRAVKLLVRDPQRVDAAAKEATQVLRDRHGLAEGQPNDFTVLSSSVVEKNVRKVQRVLFVYLPLVAFVSLLAGGAVAATLMLSSVSERVSEIGLRRAVGARPQDIRLQFLLETAVTALGGGLAGAVIGSGLAIFLGGRFNLGISASPFAVSLGLALAALTGLLAGVLPARRAALLEPAVALR